MEINESLNKADESNEINFLSSQSLPPYLFHIKKSLMKFFNKSCSTLQAWVKKLKSSGLNFSFPYCVCAGKLFTYNKLSRFYVCPIWLWIWMSCQQHCSIAPAHEKFLFWSPRYGQTIQFSHLHLLCQWTMPHTFYRVR